MKSFGSGLVIFMLFIETVYSSDIKATIDSAYASKSYEQVIQIFSETNNRSESMSLDAYSLGKIGKSYYFLEDFLTAKNILIDALQLHQSNREYFESYAACYYISSSFKSLYVLDSTRYYAEQALNFAKLTSNSEHIASASNNLAIIYEDNGQYLDALLLYNQAIELNQEDSAFVMKMKCNKGQSYYHLGILDSAFSLMNSAYRFFKSTSNDDYWRWLSTYRLANIEQSSKNHLAASYYREVLELSTNSYDSTLALAGISKSMLLNSEDSSTFYLDKATEIAKKVQNLTLSRLVCFIRITSYLEDESNLNLIPDLLEEGRSYQKIDPDSISLSFLYEYESQFFMQSGDQSKSLMAIDNAIATTTKHDQKTRLSEALTQKFNVLNHFGRYKEALEVKEEEIKVQQELFNDRSEAVYQILRTQNEMDKQESTIANQQLEIDNNNLQITIMYISIALVVSALVFIFWQYRTRSKYAQKLETMFLDSRHRYMNNLLLLKNWFNEGKTENNDEIISFAQNRIDAISTVNRHLDRLSYNKDTIESQSFLEDISHNLLANREFTSEIENVPINMSVSGPLGMITNEIITNGLKYGEEPYAIRFHKNGQGYILEIEDHGPGIADPEKKGTGSKVLRLLSRQLKGELTYENKADHTPEGRGTLVSLTFKG